MLGLGGAWHAGMDRNLACAFVGCLDVALFAEGRAFFSPLPPPPTPPPLEPSPPLSPFVPPPLSAESLEEATAVVEGHIKMAAKAGNKLESNVAYSVVWTISIRSRRSVMILRASESWWLWLAELLAAEVMAVVAAVGRELRLELRRRRRMVSQ